MRYFVKMDLNIPYSLYRFQMPHEQHWLPDRGWRDSNKISAYLAIGEGDYDEITEELARKTFPAAFQDNDAPAQLFNSDYRVLLSGSSIIGVIDSSESWLKAQQFLVKKFRDEKVHCFRWWCKECEKFPLVFEEDIPGHVIKITFPNVLKLTADLKVKWVWQDPNSEWARNNGTAPDAFNTLVVNKSRPKWVVVISKPKY